jgi:cobalamin biosynthesis protein CobW
VIPAAKIPATVVTGFLGAGKTTLIRRLLADNGGRRIAVIVNEFGDVGVDGSLLSDCGDRACAAEDIIELANGCLCCTVAQSFLPAMEGLLDRANPPDHILIETSGLALPKPLVKAFDWPAIRARVTVDGVIVVVDALAYAEGRFTPSASPLAEHENPLEEVFDDQLACADLVLMTKLDLLAAGQDGVLAERLQNRLRPGVKVVGTRQGAIDTAVLLGLSAATEDDLDARPTRHDTALDHDHDDFESFAVTLAPVPHPESLQERLRAVIAAHDILRLKGILAVAGKNMRHVIQAVGPRLAGYYDRPWRADEIRAGRLVVIGRRGLDRTAIAAAIGGVPTPDGV